MDTFSVATLAERNIAQEMAVFFSRFRVDLQSIIMSLYMWSYKVKMHQIMGMVPLGNIKTSVDYLQFFRDICSTWLLRQQHGQLGGPGKIVEIDETKIGGIVFIELVTWNDIKLSVIPG